ncbi:hypothetical protein TKK_0010122 [Trichogramma kaykai]
MPPDRTHALAWIKPYPNVFTYDGKTLYCHVCEKVVKCERKFLVKQHVDTLNYQARLRNKEPRQTQLSQVVVTPQQNEFSKNLCETLVACNIPFYKLSNPHLKGFLKK